MQRRAEPVVVEDLKSVDDPAEPLGEVDGLAAGLLLMVDVRQARGSPMTAAEALTDLASPCRVLLSNPEAGS